MPFKDREKHREALRQTNRRRAQERRLYIQQEKSKPCADCGIQYPYYVMDFDHVRGVKKVRVSALVNAAWETLKAEIAKCDVVCANCHRLRHAPDLR